jgi:hypothetical protein
MVRVTRWWLLYSGSNGSLLSSGIWRRALWWIGKCCHLLQGARVVCLSVCPSVFNCPYFANPLSRSVAVYFETLCERLTCTGIQLRLLVGWLVVVVTPQKRVPRIDRPYVLCSCYTPPPPIVFMYVPLHSSSRRLHTYWYDKPFRLVCIGHGRLERNAPVRRMRVEGHSLRSKLQEDYVMSQWQL